MGAQRARKTVSPPVSAHAEPDLHIIVPVYNEAENFPPFYESLKKNVHTPHKVVVVYDFEEDTTVPVVKKLAEKDASLVLVRNPNRGVINALRVGLAYPKSGAVLVTMADLSDDHACVDQMYEQYKAGSDVVAASRYSRGGGQKGGPKFKAALSRTAGLTLHFLGGVPTLDPTNNFKLYSKAFLDSVTIESTKGFEVALELTVKAHLAGRKVTELPTVWSNRVAGQSNFKLFKWMPAYLRWYTHAFEGRLLSALRR